jgi:hypothetical protein
MWIVGPHIESWIALTADRGNVFEQGLAQVSACSHVPLTYILHNETPLLFVYYFGRYNLIIICFRAIMYTPKGKKHTEGDCHDKEF